MKQGGGDFSAEAYEQLREAYNKEQQRQVDDELAGTQLMGQQYGLETAPIDSPWADKIDLWQYPDGKRPHEDNKQSPDEILQIMRDAAQERIDANKEPEETEEVEEEEEVTEEVETEDEDETETETEDDEEESEEEEEVEEESEEDDEEVEESEEEEVEEDEEELDPEAIADQIAELRAELEAMSFVPESEEEPEADDESE